MGANAGFVRAHPDLFPRLRGFERLDPTGWPTFLRGDWPAESLELLTTFRRPHGNLWTPDTCVGVAQAQGCAVHFFFEHDQAQEARIHTCIFVERACDAHRHLPAGHGLARDANGGHSPVADTVWDAIHEENHRKNIAEGLALRALKDHVESDASGTPAWAEGVQFEWAFDEDRHLTIGVTAATPIPAPHATALQSTLDEAFPGRARLTHGA